MLSILPVVNVKHKINTKKKRKINHPVLHAYYVNVSALIKFSQKTSVFTILHSPLNRMLYVVDVY